MGMVIRDADLRNAVVEDGLRPGDPSWKLLCELQRLRDDQNRGQEAQGRAPRHPPRGPGRRKP